MEKRLMLKSKRIICFIFLFLSLAMMSSVAKADNSCGTDVTWEITDAGTLIISGEGAMEDYKGYSWKPWYTSYGRVKSIVIKNGVTHIGDHAFADLMCAYYGENDRDAGKVTSITIPSSVTSIGNAAFYSNRWFESISLPSSVKEIGEEAFRSCTRLKCITIPNGVTEIKYKTFDYCLSLEKINIPDSVAKIGGYAFTYIDGIKEFTIPNSVNELGDNVFEGCKNLTKVVIPSSVRWSGNALFTGCDNLESVYFYGSPMENNDYYKDTARVFRNVPSNITAYYPFNDPAWTADVREKMQGSANVSWVPWNPDTGELNPVIVLSLKSADVALSKNSFKYTGCQTAHYGRRKPHFDFGESASPIVPYRYLPQTLSGMTAGCRSLV